MKGKLECFLQAVSADIAVQESNYNKIKTIYEKLFEINISPKNHKLHFYFILFNDEIESFKRKFYADMVDMLTVQEEKEHIILVQKTINHIKNLILSQIGENERYYIHISTLPTDEVTIRNIYKIIYVCLDRFLFYLEKKYEDQLNLDGYLSTENYVVTLNKIFETAHTLQEFFGQYIEDNELLSMVEYPLVRLDRMPEGEKIKLWELLYCKKFVSVLTDLANEKGKNITKIELIETLVTLNFNTSRFFVYCTNFIGRQVNKASSTKLKKETLSYFYKRLKNTELRIKEGFKRENQTIKVMLMNYCHDEMKSLKSDKEKPSISIEEGIVKIKPPGLESQIKVTDKINLGNTVEELVLLIHIMKEAGGITNKSLCPVWRILAHFACTRYSEQPSYDNLRNTYYEVHKLKIQEALTLYQKLMEVIRSIKKEY